MDHLPPSRRMRWRHIAVLAIVAVYLAGAAWLVFGPNPGSEAHAVGTRVRAAEEILERSERVDRATERLLPRVSDEELSNVLLFVPVPILAGLLSTRWWWLSIPGGVGASIAIEAAQREFLDHRTPTWNDVRWNTVGVLVGAAVVAVALALRWALLSRRRTPAG